MTNDSIVNVTEAQANLPKLIRRDCFTIARHGKVVGVFLSRERIEALLESMELLDNPEFDKALAEYKAGRVKPIDVEALDPAMSA